MTRERELAGAAPDGAAAIVDDIGKLSPRRVMRAMARTGAATPSGFELRHAIGARLWRASRGLFAPPERGFQEN